MTLFRSRQLVDAFRWTGGPDQTEDPEWIVAALDSGAAGIVTEPAGSEYPLTMELRLPNGGWDVAKPGDWIVRDGDGRITSYDAQRFAELYDAGDEARQASDEALRALAQAEEGGGVMGALRDMATDIGREKSP